MVLGTRRFYRSTPDECFVRGVCGGSKFSIVLASINVYNIGAVLELIEVLP